MENEGLILQNLLEINKKMGEFGGRLENIERVLVGNDGNEGLVRRVEDLESARSYAKGGMYVLGAVGSLVWARLEWMVHAAKTAMMLHK